MMSPPISRWYGLKPPSPNPALQVGTQLPPVQTVDPLPFEQPAPHAPQFAVLVLRFDSQPLAALPSQLPNPALQDGEHVPATQLFEPFTIWH